MSDIAVGKTTGTRQFRPIHILAAVAVFAGFAWTVPLHLPLHSIGFYCLWTLVVVVQVILSRSCRPELPGDQMRESAYDITHAVGTISVGTWLLVAIAFGCIRGWHDLPKNPAIAMMIPIGFWFPVCLTGNILSMLLYPMLDAPRLFLFRIVSVAAMSVPFVWICFETQN